MKTTDFKPGDYVKHIDSHASGTVTSINNKYVFVQWQNKKQACLPDTLILMDDKLVAKYDSVQSQSNKAVVPAIKNLKKQKEQADCLNVDDVTMDKLRTLKSKLS